MTFFQPLGKMTFEEKVEVLFQNVKVAEGEVLSLDVNNNVNTRDPIFRMENCTFEGENHSEIAVRRYKGVILEW